MYLAKPNYGTKVNHVSDILSMSDFDYHLPPERIAQTPLEPRDSSRLLVLERATQTITHEASFRAILNYLKAGDTLVVNESRVLPARIFGRKTISGGRIELLLLQPRSADSKTIWECLVRPGRGMRAGATLLFGDEADSLAATVIGESPSGGRFVEFAEPPLAFLNRHGQMPLPPYIHPTLSDPNRYQTIYANPDATGSAAAPTAGLHFTPELLAALAAKGVGLERVQLHIGLDTFQPVKVENALEHQMHSEWCFLEHEVAERLNACRANGGRIVAVGTTAVRTLESAFDPTSQKLQAFADQTRIFIYPGKPLKAIDALITNFHLPRSTLLLLVSAFAGRELILRAYQEAIKEEYRFFSFGDAMFIF